MRDALWLEAVRYGLSPDLIAVLGTFDNADEICEADPLGADAFLADLSEMNARGNTQDLCDFVRDVVSRPGIDRLARASTLAAMRDLGIVLGSLQVQGIQPEDIDPRISPLLRTWGERTHMVPRDTVLHYGPWNPRGLRERTYTGDEQESILIESTREASDLLPAMALHVFVAHDHGLETERGLEGLIAARRMFRDFAAAFDQVQKSVSPVFFAQRLRPYFEPITVGGTRYHGPAAAFLPIYLVDTLLWGDDGPAHRAMMDEAALYGIEPWRTLLSWCRETPSLAQVYEDATQDTSGSIALSEQGELITELLHLLVRFRGRHATLARQAYSAAVTDFGTGSGGYSPEILTQITRATRDAEHAVHSHVPGIQGTP